VGAESQRRDTQCTKFHKKVRTIATCRDAECIDMILELVIETKRERLFCWVPVRSKAKERKAKERSSKEGNQLPDRGTRWVRRKEGRNSACRGWIHGRLKRREATNRKGLSACLVYVREAQSVASMQRSLNERVYRLVLLVLLLLSHLLTHNQ